MVKRISNANPHCAASSWYLRLSLVVIFQHEFSLPLDKRLGFLVIWLLDDQAVGFSSCDKIVFAERANMHLHVAEPQRRHQGIGTECVRRSVEIYFQKPRLKSLFCEPNAFNVGPNRTLQKVGFKYLRPT
jgi:RimJ/RimL family protein N-acetyltransferase